MHASTADNSRLETKCMLSITAFKITQAGTPCIPVSPRLVVLVLAHVLTWTCSIYVIACACVYAYGPLCTNVGL